MNRRAIVAILISAILILAGAAAFFLLTQDPPEPPENQTPVGESPETEGMDCVEIYDEILEGEKPVEDLPERCEPVPEEVERELYGQMLEG